MPRRKNTSIFASHPRFREYLVGVRKAIASVSAGRKNPTRNGILVAFVAETDFSFEAMGRIYDGIALPHVETFRKILAHSRLDEGGRECLLALYEEIHTELFRLRRLDRVTNERQS